MSFERGEILDVKQFHGLQAHRLGGMAELIEGDFVVTPLAHRMVDPALQLWCRRLGGAETVAEIRRGGGHSRHRGDFSEN